MKLCEEGNHMVERLFWSKKPNRKSACLSCSRKYHTPIGNYKITKKAVSSDIKPLEKRTPKEDKSIPELIKLATIVFNKWIRQRDTINDKSFVCISCHKIKSVDVMQAGHYLSAGSNSSIRFNDWNVNGQCVECNCMKEGNQKEYRIGLIEKIGESAVEALEESASLPYKWDREFLLDIIKKYK